MVTNSRAQGRKWPLSASVALWGLLLAVGYLQLVRYQFTGSTAAAAPSQYPAAFGFPRSAGRPMLVISLHPRCPCSRASLEELARIMSHSPVPIDVVALFYKPAGEPEDWVETGLYRDAKRMGCRTGIDEAGALARRLGATTSGHVVLYDSSGMLRYKGGITGSRGHQGANAGETAVLEVLGGHQTESTQRQVFGCSLLDNQPVGEEQAR